MNIFDKSKIKHDINNLPTKYLPTKNSFSRLYIKYSQISDVWIGDIRYSLTLFEEKDIINFIDPKEFQYFCWKNILKITKIQESYPTYSTIFHLKNGLIHNQVDYAFTKIENDGKITSKNYYINGVEITIFEFNRQLRLKKFNKIIKK